MQASLFAPKDSDGSLFPGAGAVVGTEAFNAQVMCTLFIFLSLLVLGVWFTVSGTLPKDRLLCSYTGDVSIPGSVAILMDCSSGVV